VTVPIAGAVGPSAYWYLTRATGAVALILLTLSLALGVIDVGRYTTPRAPRFLVDGLHRTASLLAVVFLIGHILTAALDSFASIPLIDAVVPFAGSYRPLWLGLGAVSFDLLLAIVVTSLLRRRLGYRAWRLTHWLAYGSWPIALLHGLGTGSDVTTSWMLAISGGCLAVVLISICARVAGGEAGGGANRNPARGIALAGALCFAGGLALWLPGGPLGSHWAKRSGTPASLLAPSHRSPG
jgi:methionine sulfoxide reductase heme-binding subunit